MSVSVAVARQTREGLQRLTVATLSFYYMAAVCVACAFLAVTRRNPVHSILWVLALFMHVAAIFLILGAEFVAAVQVLVYAGAILIFYLFVQMLLDLPGEEARPRFGRHWPFAAALVLALAAFTWIAQTETFDSATVEEKPALAEAESYGGLEEVGRALFGPFALPFEMASLVLLAAIIGAVVLARRRPATT